MFSPVILSRSRDLNQHGEEKRGINLTDYIVFSMVSRPSTPFFDLLQHKYKELWMEQQRARTAAERMEKKKVITLQQCSPLLCPALLPGITPSLSHPTMDGLLPATGGAVSWENVLLAY